MTIQTIRESALEFKKIVLEGYNINIGKYVQEVSERSSFSFSELKELYNLIAMWGTEEDKFKNLSSNKSRAWTKSEDDLIVYYVDLSLKEKRNKKNKSKGNAISELEDILERTRNAINFRYYNLIKENKELENKEENSDKNEEIKNELEKTTPSNTNERENDSEEKIDLLDVVVDFVENVDEVGVNIDDLFKGLLEISKKAVEKNENKKELTLLQSQLSEQKEINNELQKSLSSLYAEFNKLRREVEYFEGLNGKQKLQQLHNYNKKLKYIIDKFGGVVDVKQVENMG